MDRRTLLDQRDKAMRAVAMPDLPQDLRTMAKKAADHADVALGMQDAQAKQSSNPQQVVSSPGMVVPQAPIGLTDDPTQP